MNRCKLLVLLVVCFTQWGFSQVNLVINGGFENYSSCPSIMSQIWKAEYWGSEHGTCDFFHVCGSAEVSVPDNLLGYQPPNDSGIAGFLTFTNIFAGGQEISVGQLSQPLSAGEKYRVKMKVSFADSANYAVCCVGARLSSSPPPSPPFVQNWSSVELVIDSLDYDASTWFQLDDLFTAQGGEDKIYLGALRPEADLNPYIVGDTSNAFYNIAYFYIDDVEVYEDDLVSIKPNKATEFKIRSLAGSQLRMEVSESMNMTLLDVSGRAVFSERLLSGTSTLDVSKLPNGLYIAALQEPNGNWVGTRKVVLQQ